MKSVDNGVEVDVEEELKIVAQLYCLYDLVAEKAYNLTEASNAQDAVRALRISMKDNPNPQDYELRYVGVKYENGAIGNLIYSDGPADYRVVPWRKDESKAN